MFRKKGFWVTLFVLLALGVGGGYAYYNYVYQPSLAPAEQTIATAQVSRGDLIISVSGSGTLYPASEVDLGFETGGYLDEMLVKVGDRVQQGDVVARLETDDLALAVAEAEIKLRQAQLDLADASEEATASELADAEARGGGADVGEDRRRRRHAGEVAEVEVVPRRLDGAEGGGLTVVRVPGDAEAVAVERLIAVGRVEALVDERLPR